MGRNNLPSEKDDWEKCEKNNVTIALHILYVKKEKCILFLFENITQILKKTLFFYWFQLEKNAKLGPKNDGIILHLKKISALLRGITKKNNDFYCLNI